MSNREIEKQHIANEIRFLFLTKWLNKWIPESELRQQNRVWNQVFQELIKQGFIIKKKDGMYTKYKWRDYLNNKNKISKKSL